MQRFNIVTKRTYKTKSGEEKTAWNNVGSLVHFPASGDKDEGFALELNMHPDTKFYVFPQKSREERRQTDPADGTDDQPW